MKRKWSPLALQCRIWPARRRKCGESAKRIRLTVHKLPATVVWYLLLVQAYPEQDIAQGERAWCHGVLVTRG